MDVTVRCDNDAVVGIEGWIEVTGEFIEATKDLKLGELLHDENFGLFDAMSAIEMMDPKMDAGMACNREKKVLNFQQAVSEGKLKIKDLTNEERIGIIDDTFSCLVTWLEGHSLAQTVFTNLYLHSPSSIEDKCLASFSFLTLKLVDIVKQFVLRANMVEDEDFQSGHVYHVPCDISDTKVLTMTRLIEEEYQRKVKSFQRNTQEKSKRHINNNDDRPTDVNEKANNQSNDLPNDKSIDQNSSPSLDKEFEENSALHSRMKFCRLFFQSLINLKKEVFTKSDNPKEFSVTLAAIDDVDKLLQQCGEIIQAWKKTLDLGIKPDPNTGSACYYRADYPTIMGFEPLINQRLLPPTFPRYTKMRSREEALKFMANLVSRIRHVCKIYQVQTFHAALDFFTEFSQPSPTSSSCVLSRSILQVLYIRGIPIVNKIFGITPLSEALREDVKNFIKPPSLCYKPSILNTYPQAKEFLDIFFTRCIKPMFFLIQINGHNRARQRDKLAQVLDELAALQEEAERVDNFLHNLLQKQEIPCSHLGFFSTWVLYHTIRVMIQYLLSGFELELYSAHEYSYIYWYLYEFLFNWMVSTLNRARTFIQEQESLADQKNRNAKKSRQRKRKQKPHEREWILYQALQQLCGGYFRTVSAFRLENKLKLPWTGLHGERIRYEHRFMPFNVVITPPPVTYSQYKEMTDFCNDEKDGNRTNDLYIKACKCFQQAKVLLESVPDPNEEITSLIKVAKTNFVVIKLLLSGHKEDSKSLPEFDFSTNNKFPIIRIL